MNILVSVLLATRNRQRQLAHALASLRRQSHTEIEILVCDDGSSDATPDFLARLSQSEHRLRWFRHERSRGLAAALNALIAESRGAWLARMDDDDRAHPRRIELQLAYMQANRLDLCGTWYRRVAGWRRSVARPPIEHDRILGELLFQPPLLHPSVMMRRQLLTYHGGYSEQAPHAEDYELWVRLMPHARFGNCPAVLLDYTLSRRQVSRQHHAEQNAQARALRVRALAQLGIKATAEQAKLHASLRDPVALEHLVQLDQIEDWLEELASQLKSGARLAVVRQWFLQCVRAAGLGPQVYRRYRASPLASDGRQRQAILWALCQARLPYRSPLYDLLEPLASIG